MVLGKMQLRVHVVILQLGARLSAYETYGFIVLPEFSLGANRLERGEEHGLYCLPIQDFDENEPYVIHKFHLPNLIWADARRRWVDPKIHQAFFCSVKQQVLNAGDRVIADA